MKYLLFEPKVNWKQINAYQCKENSFYAQFSLNTKPMHYMPPNWITGILKIYK
jgi:hypothetical protein